MPRLARLEAPGALHRIMIRGIERLAIFKLDKLTDFSVTRIKIETKNKGYNKLDS